MTTLDYWEECLANSCEENGVQATAEQLAAIADDLRNAHDNYGMAFGAPESPYPREIADLEQKLKAERDKVICRVCNGSGVNVSHGPIHSATSQCWKCRGEGRHS